MSSCALALALAVAIPATARAKAYAPDVIALSVDNDDLKAIVASLGHTLDKVDFNTDVAVSATDERGTKYVMIGTACGVNGVAGCQGIAMQVRFDQGAGDVSLEKLAKANMSQLAVSTAWEPDAKVIAVTRYVVLDHGVTMANIRENLAVLLAVTPEVAKILFAG
jgi:hypothetical protein